MMLPRQPLSLGAPWRPCTTTRSLGRKLDTVCEKLEALEDSPSDGAVVMSSKGISGGGGLSRSGGTGSNHSIVKCPRSARICLPLKPNTKSESQSLWAGTVVSQFVRSLFMPSRHCGCASHALTSIVLSSEGLRKHTRVTHQQQQRLVPL